MDLRVTEGNAPAQLRGRAMYYLPILRIVPTAAESKEERSCTREQTLRRIISLLLEDPVVFDAPYLLSVEQHLQRRLRHPPGPDGRLPLRE